MKICFEFDVTPLEARRLFGFDGDVGPLPESDSAGEVYDRPNVDAKEIAGSTERMISGD